MRRFSTRGSAALRAGCLAACLGACHSAPTRLYTLYPVAPAPPERAAPESTGAPASPGRAEDAAPYTWPQLRVDAVQLPPALDRAEVVSEVSPGELQVHDLAQWSAPLAQLAKQALAADLGSRLPAGKLVSVHLPKPPGALGVTVDLVSFRSAAGGARLEASWGIIGPHTDPGAYQRAAVLTCSASEAASASGAASAMDADSTARTLSLLLGRLADRIVADLALNRP